MKESRGLAGPRQGNEDSEGFGIGVEIESLESGFEVGGEEVLEIRGLGSDSEIDVEGHASVSICAQSREFEGRSSYRGYVQLGRSLRAERDQRMVFVRL